MDAVPQIRWSAVRGLMIACAVVSFPLGCRGKAHDDLYREQLTGKLRKLEDRLYQADYQNQVLAQKLQRAKQRLEDRERNPRREARPPETSDERNRFNERQRDAQQDEELPRPEETVPEMSPDFELDPGSMIDPGVPFSPDDLPSAPEDQAGAAGADENARDTDPPSAGPVVTPQPDARRTLPEPRETSGASGSDDGERGGTMTPPGEPEPPGTSDLTFPPIDEGEIAPPSDEDGGATDPPGQIRLDDSLRFLGVDPSQTPEPQPPTLSVPQGLKLHPTLSGRFDFERDAEAVDDAPATGLLLVVTAIDDRGRSVNLETFDIDAEMTIVALDPEKNASTARIGRWEFGPKDVAGFVREHPVSGLHIPVQWQSELPSGKEVLVHVRLRNGEQQMQCEGRVKLEPAPAVAQWTPRGEAKARRD